MRIETGDGEDIGGVMRLNGFFEKVRGLSFRDEGRALLEFPYSDRHGIWMPFMRFALDLAFLDEDGRVVGVERGVKPVSFDPRTWKVYRPPTMCRYVLEVEAGLLDEKSVSVGDRLELRF